MRLLLLITAITFTLTLGSCNQEDCCGLPPTIEGRWTLTEISGGLAGIDETYPADEIIWEFTGRQLLITDNHDGVAIPSRLASGTYPYMLDVLDGELQLIINEQSYGIVNVDFQTLSLDQRAADGSLITFLRIN